MSRIWRSLYRIIGFTGLGFVGITLFIKFSQSLDPTLVKADGTTMLGDSVYVILVPIVLCAVIVEVIRAIQGR